MKPRKIKIAQYLVRGKRQTYFVLVFPRKKWLWAYFDYSDERYEIDGDPAAYQQIKYALAALIANSGKIAYFPIKRPWDGRCYNENYDAVLLRPELQFKRSEWISLRRQLDKAHRVKDFELYYEPQKLYDHFEELSHNENKMAKLSRGNGRPVARLEGDTVFFAVYRDICYSYHYDIIETEKLVWSGFWGPWECCPICEIGYMITTGWKKFASSKKPER